MTWPNNATVIAHFSRGKSSATAGRFRIVCVPTREPSVEVSVTDTDALGVSVQRWTAARDFDKPKVAEILRDALLKAFAILPPFQQMLYAPGVVARDGHIEIELGSLP